MTETTSRFASTTVGDFLRGATPGQRMWFLSRGEPQCLSGSFLIGKMPDGRFETKLFPGLRGVRVGDEVKTAEEGIAKAAEVRADLLARDNLEPVDEEALGIDDEAVDLAERFNDVGARLEQIMHIGAMLADEGSEPLREFIDDLDPDDAGRLAIYTDIPFLARVAGEEEPRKARADTEAEGGEDDDDEDEDDARMRPLDERVDEFTMLCHDHGVMGFIVEVSVPHYTPHGDGRSCSVHLGTRYIERRYGSTFKVACDRALGWAETKIEEMRTKKAA